MRNVHPYARSIAQAAGEQFFWTGLPCKHGHVVWRRTNNGKCLDCAPIEQKRTYQRHRVSRIERVQKFYQQNRDDVLAYKHEYYMANTERKKAYNAAYYRRRRDGDSAQR